MSRVVDVTCPDCGTHLRGHLIEPTVFVEYPHRTGDRKGWCRKGTWTVDPSTVTSQERLELGGVA